MPSSQSAFIEEMTAKAAQDAASHVESLQTAHLRCAWLSGSWQLTKAWDVVEKQPSAAELLQLGGVARTGMRMFKGMSTFTRLGCLLMQTHEPVVYSQTCPSTCDIGMEFFVTNEKLYLTATTKLPWLKVSPESYKLDGSDSLHNRRDMRKGETWHVLHQVNSCAFALL